ncbi:MAG: protein translocase subunit SecF [Blastocatellia bacterium]|nr:protein translocase subunit SecF [Blastocatellia bacterium]
MIEIFKNPNYDFLGKAKYFIAFSIIISIAGFISMAARGFNMGVDFAGGTKVTVRFKSSPDEVRVRDALFKQNNKVFEKDKVVIQRTGKQLNQADRNEIFITTPLAEKKDILEALNKYYAAAPTPAGMVDVNNNGASSIADQLLEKDPLNLKTTLAPGEAAKEYARFADNVVKFRDQSGGGLIGDLNQIPLQGFNPQFGDAVKKTFVAGDFNIVSVDSVGPQVGKDLQTRAIYVTLLSCFGMLVFIAFRFERIYGVAAVIATLHDVIVTLGIFSLFQWEISLTFIAAMLTLIGYSMNDTIVIFDRIRETLKLRRREDLVKVTNDAINQTLSRTIIASGLTLLSVIALVVFGGEVLKSFSLCLLIGILIGTYSSIAIASPVVIWWKNREEKLKQEETAKKPTRSAGGPKSAAKSAEAR